MEKQLIKIGSQYKDGKVIGIFKTGVLTIHGTLQRFHLKESVERELAKASK